MEPSIGFEPIMAGSLTAEWFSELVAVIMCFSYGNQLDALDSVW